MCICGGGGEQSEREMADSERRACVNRGGFCGPFWG